MNIVFAAIAPHPPILLPSVGSESDREKVRGTISKMEELGDIFEIARPDRLIISSPHPEWGFEVPLFFLARGFEGEIDRTLTDLEDPRSHFERGKRSFDAGIDGEEHRVALIASGDLSHRLKEDGPYGSHPDGERFDSELLRSLKEGDFETVLTLDGKYPQAGECGLRSIAFILGILEGRRERTDKSFSLDGVFYEGPFGVGYLTANFSV